MAVLRAGPNRRPDEFLHEFTPHVFDHGLDRAGIQRLLADRFQVFALAQVGAERYHVQPFHFLEPRNAHGRIQPAAIGQNNLGHGDSKLPSIREIQCR